MVRILAILLNVGHVQTTVGDVLWFAIPDDTFHDHEDGDTSNLQLQFLTFENQFTITPDSWIQLNQTSRTLYGLPLLDDVGRHKYYLAAADSRGRVVRMAFEVDVSENPLQDRLSHEISLLLDLDYEQFIYKVTHTPF